MHWRNRRRVRRRTSGRSFVYNLRFPGQYYDAETGLNYNYFRDYDPATGRYIESDPIGLDGGINTYAYVNDTPIMDEDTNGLEAVSYMLHHPIVPPQPWPAYVSPEAKAVLCKLINDCQGDMNCVFNKMNAGRKKAWSDPTLRQAENFATAASDSYDVYGYSWGAHTEFGVWFYQYVGKPFKQGMNWPTTPVSYDAYRAGVAGLDLYHQSRDAALKWCNQCGSK